MKRYQARALAFFLMIACGQVLRPALAASPDYPPPEEVKAAFLKLLDRPKVALEPREIESPRTADGLVTEHFDVATEKAADGHVERVPMLLVRPENIAGRLPAVIVLHGTGGSKEGMQPLLTALAKRGFVALAIDARFHGERAGGAKGAAAYNQAIIRAWRSPAGQPQEHPFYYDTCWDLWRVTDYLSQRPDVDPQRIGMVGFSMGGIETWLAAAVDPRVSVAVPAIGVQSFRWSLEHDAWHARAKTIGAAHEAAREDLGEAAVNERVCRDLWTKIIPGILDQFDCPSMIRLFVGRPLLILNGELDRNCPLEGAELAFASAREAYSAAGASDKLRVEVAKGIGHTITASQQDLTLDWLEKWLKR